MVGLLFLIEEEGLEFGSHCWQKSRQRCPRSDEVLVCAIFCVSGVIIFFYKKKKMNEWRKSSSGESGTCSI